MSNSNYRVSLLTAAALFATAALPSLVVPLTPATAQAFSPMPPGCKAASDAVQAEGNRYRMPSSSESTVVQMQHILFLSGLLLDTLDRSCRDWADYERSRQQFQTQYNGTMRTCKQVASNPADCRRKAYGS